MAGVADTQSNKVLDYDVNFKTVLGKGAMGIVHPATDKKGNKVAAKRIDYRDKSMGENIAKALENISRLKHQNVVQILDTAEQPFVVWIFMEFCQLGDLEKYFTTKERNKAETLDIMLGIARGVEYLHSKNVIHRDIKPTNILISGGSPVVPKLTDFDLSKFLEEDYETSAMTTDVGTKAFKAPEFWMRTKEGKLNYHRNVDVYAMGLTYLAMIQGNKKLVPKLETTNDDSELHQSIGAVMAERVRYRVEPLMVLKAEESSQEMTMVQPENRLRASQVVSTLMRIVRMVSHICFYFSKWVDTARASHVELEGGLVCFQKYLFNVSSTNPEL